MSPFAIMVYVAIGLAFGMLVRPIVRGSPFWSALAVLLGFVGAVLGRWVALATHLPFGATLQPTALIWSITGALLLVGWGISAQVLVVDSRPAR